MSRRFDAVLFDFGGVFTASPFDMAEQAGAAAGAESGLLVRLVFGPYHEDTDHPWHRLERGEISLAHAREAIIALGRAEGLDTDPFTVLASMAQAGGVREPVVASARGLREAGVRTALVTNNVAEFAGAWRAMLPAEELFEVIVDSSEVGLRKPNPAIFHHTLELLGGIEAARAVFLDDFAGNVEAARALGMHAIHVGPDPAEALAELDTLFQA